MIKKLDHLVITTADLEKCLSFYETLGFQVKQTPGRYELFAGDFKLNVHVLHHELFPHAQHVQPGSADLCFEVEDVEAFLTIAVEHNLVIEEGIVPRTGVNGPMQSLYLRDPDGNLLEFSSYTL